MADDDLTARLQWPSDPDSPFSGARGPKVAPARPLGAADDGGPRSAARAEPDDLSGELAALRRAVEASGVDLAPVVAAVDELRGSIEELRLEVAELRSVAGLGADVAALAGEGVDLQALRDEMVALRRRISLRGQAPEVAVSDEHIERVVAAVLDRLQDRAAPARSGRRHR